jgi:hypothetical protein
MRKLNNKKQTSVNVSKATLIHFGIKMCLFFLG